ncbi:WASH complex subunit 2 [Anopheles aquasalis]|uniref:WASH complex subunit 2 n=1 Tax=Anopheles aquasalis TaxID=42839 RepID=UPI00215B5DA6|nr:WASH complex subunit 2 [Anopheles aquasalis]
MGLTPEDLRQRIPNWSLESDGQLLQYMVSIAKNLEDKCSNTRDSLSGLMVQVDQTELKLAHTLNQLSAVEQVKFVENRVEEDDESFYGLRRRKQAEEEKEKAQAKAEQQDSTVDDMIQAAVERSIEGMYKCYEKVSLHLGSDSSSDDDEDDDDDYDGRNGSGAMPLVIEGGGVVGSGKPTIMRAVPRFSFIERPLPHVIGSKEWQSKWHVGLIDSDDESSSDRKEEYSESSSDTDGMFPSQPNSKNQTPSESESSIWGTDPRKRTYSIDHPGDDASSVYSYASSSKPRTLFPAVQPIGHGLSGGLKPPSLFPEEPPDEMEPNGPTTADRFDKGLFDASPEEIVTPIAQPRVKPATTGDSFFRGTSQPTRKMVNLFDDEPPPVFEEQPSGKRESETGRGTINLFIDSEDEADVMNNVRNNNDSLPTEPTVAPSNAPRFPPKTNPRSMTKVVDELNNNFRKQQVQPAVREHPKPANSVPGNGQDTSRVQTEPNVPKQSDQLPSTVVRAVQPPDPDARTVKQVTKKSVVNLFDDDDENGDDDDGIVVGRSELPPIPPIAARFATPHNRSPAKKKSIFDDSDESDTDDALLFGRTSRTAMPAPAPLSIAQPTTAEVSKSADKKKVKSIFSDSSEEENEADDALFGNAASIVKNKLEALRQKVDTPSEVSKPNNEPAKKSSKSIFEDEASSGDDGLFGIQAKPEMKPSHSSAAVTDGPTKSAPKARVSLFDDQPPSDDENDDTLFGGGRSSIGGITAQLNNKMPVSEPKPEPDPPQIVEDPVPVNSASKATDDTTTVGVRSEIPATGKTSIRSAIMKKSIFHSDTESEQGDDADGLFTGQTNDGNGELQSAAEVSEAGNASNDANAENVQTSSVASESSNVDQPRKEDVTSISATTESMEGEANLFVTSNPVAQNDQKENDKKPHPEPMEDQMIDPIAVSRKYVSDESSVAGSSKDEGQQLETPPIEDKPVSASQKPDNSPFNDPPLMPESNVETNLVSDESNVPQIANDIDYLLHTNAIPGVADEPRTPAPLAEAAKSEPKSALNFSPIGLFDDVPPPDDMDGLDSDEGPPQLTSSARNNDLSLPTDDSASSPHVYDEPQSLGFPPKESTAGSHRYLFDDEPPPDDVDNYRSVDVSMMIPGVSPFDKRIVSIDKSVSLPPFPTNEDSNASNRPKKVGNKLNTKLVINVAALLPGARRPQPPATSGSSTEATTEVLDDDQPKVKAAASVAAGSALKREPIDDKLLVSLNKDRARIPTKRKPPSRRVLRGNTNGLTDDQPADNGTEDRRIVVGSEQKIEHIEAVYPVTPEPVLDPAKDRLRASARTTGVARPPVAVGTDTPVNKVVNPQQKVLPSQTSKSIFGDSDNDENDAGDDLFSKLPTKVAPLAVASKSRQPSQAVTSGGAKVHSIFGSDDEDDDVAGSEQDLFGVSKVAKPSNSNKGGTAAASSIVGQLKSAALQKTTKGTTSSLFGNDDDADDDDDLFGSKPKTIVPKPSSERRTTTERSKLLTGDAVTRSTAKATPTPVVNDPLADLLDS